MSSAALLLEFELAAGVEAGTARHHLLHNSDQLQTGGDGGKRTPEAGPRERGKGPGEGRLMQGVKRCQQAGLQAARVGQAHL